MELLYQAHSAHREYFNTNTIQLSALLSIKTGACPENCSYCPQSAHFKTNVKKQKLLDLNTVKTSAIKAKAQGASRFCMGAAWRNPPQNAMPQIVGFIKAIKALDLEVCMTLGMLTKEQATLLSKAGLDYYNHNLDTSPEYYPEIVTTRTYEERLKTLEIVRASGIKVCCGGIMGMGEERCDRINFLQQLANLPEHPESVPINRLVTVQGTPLANTAEIDPFEFVRVIAITRILMPKSVIRLAAERENMSDELHALCFFAGANSIFNSETLLTTPNPTAERNDSILKRLNIEAAENKEKMLCKH
jgi:biotin synthase